MALFPEHLLNLAAAILNEARKKKLKLVSAESCTGGLIMACLTEVPGSSDVVDRGYISYSYDSKIKELGIDRALLERTGAVSDDVALQMATGALAASKADIAISATGIAGPGGATESKPVGLVYIGVANGKTGKSFAVKNLFGGDRSAVRLETVETALTFIKREIDAI
ncbi:MAG: CinA family protein [Alphaproteobacteria bacterium]|nr:CinA family protein [Alphaproteobacteria bacterium]